MSPMFLSSGVHAERNDSKNNDELIERCLINKCNVFYDAWQEMDLKGINCNPYASRPLVYICHCHPKAERVARYHKLVTTYKRITEDSKEWCWIEVESVSVNQSSSSYNGSWSFLPPPPKNATPAAITKYINQAVYRFQTSVVKVNSLVREIIKTKELPSFRDFLAYGGWPFLAVGIVLYMMTSVLVTYFSRYHLK